MACRSSGSSIPAPWTWAGRCRSWSGWSRETPRRIQRVSSRTAGFPLLPGHDTFHWKVFEGGNVSSSSAHPELARWRWAVTGAFGLGGITISAWGPRLPAIKADLGVGTATLGLLLAGTTLGAILGLLA